MERLGRLSRIDVRGRWLAAWLLVASAAIAALYLASGLDLEAWDDSYFFLRIGRNILEHGSAAWNLADGPVYGNTSQGFQLLALLPIALAPDHYITAVKFLSAAAAVLLFAVYARAARRSAGDSPADQAFAAGAALLAASAPLLSLLIHSGMETSASLVVLAANLVAIRGGAESRRGAAAIAATTLAVYLMRPDAVAISLGALVVSGWLRDRRPPWRALAWCAVALACAIGALYLYFGTPLPLAFYLKSRALTVYTPDFWDLGVALKRRNLAGILVMAAPLLYVAAHGRGPWIAGLLASFALFAAYHYFSTVEVMGFYGRFYAPGLVPVALAAIEAAPRFRERSRAPVTALFLVVYALVILLLYRHRLIYDEKDQVITRVALPLYLGYAAAAALLLFGARARAGVAAALVVVPILVGSWRGLPRPPLRLQSDEALLSTHIERPTTVRGIRAVRACIPEPFRIYHTEIGVPGALFQRSTVTDMAGLMDQEIALHGMDVDARCARDRPAVIFLPHRNYTALRAQFARGACLGGYQEVVHRSSSPLYIRKDLAADFLACARRVGDRWIDAR
jgi:hypothetical protein